MMKTLKSQVKLFKEVQNGWKEFLAILHHFICDITICFFGPSQYGNKLAKCLATL